MPGDDALTCQEFDHTAWLLISGELDDETRRRWERHVAGCSDCASLLAERRRVLDVYDGLTSVPEPATTVSLPAFVGGRRSVLQPVLAIAAGLLLLVGGALAGRVMWNPERGGGARDLQERVSELEIEVAAARMNQPTAAERLRAIAAGVALARRDPRFLDSLLDVLDRDPSPNVRMAAIDALYAIEPTAHVTERFDTLLASQPSPGLRIALIEMAADRRLTGTVRALERVAAAPGDQAVRDRARWAIAALTGGI